MTRRALPVLSILIALCGSARGDDLMLRARHAQLALGDLPRAIELYREALSSDTLTDARKAEAHLRLAICYHESKLPQEAKAHLGKSLYEGDDVPQSVWRKATELREQLEAAEPKPAKAVPPRIDVAAQRAKQLAKSKARARLFLRDNDVARAQFHVQRANELAPDDPEVIALAAEVETRLSGVMEFLQEPLRFVSRWTASRIRTVAKESETLLRQALVHGARGKFNLAERYFRDAIAHIDACEFAPDSYELIELRTLVREHWRNLRRKHGEADADPVLPAAPRRATLLAGYLNHLQRMLDSVSSADREYRIVPVTRPRAQPRTRSRVVPPRFTLTERPETAWTAALFASLYLPRRVHPATWTERGNYLEAAGGMLIARNHPTILDDLQDAVRRLEKTGQAPLDTRFVVVAVPPGALNSLAREYGAFRVAARGDSPLAYRVVPAKYSLEHICGFLRDEGADVKFKRDLFRVSLDNGVAQSLLIARPSKRYGLRLDAFPLREKDGGTALALKVSARHPAPPIAKLPMRFLSQSGELFADIPPGATLVVGGIVNPFSAEAGGELLLLWEGRPGAAKDPDVAPSQGFEVSLRKLLLEVRDNPGPRADKERGFVRREPLDVVRDRARFLEALLRDGLGSDAIVVNPEAAVAFVPPQLRVEATALVAQLERESRRSYVIRVISRSVRTKAFEHWIALEKLPLVAFGTASSALREGTAASVVRRLVPFEKDEVFAPADAWPAASTLGLQSAHCMHGRLRTSPTYTSKDDIAAGATRMITEGTRVSIRPYVWRGELRAWIEVEVAGLQTEVEELSLSRAVPSYRTEVAGTRVGGLVSLGSARNPKTALICRIPHPTASTLETLTELVIVVSIRTAR